MTSNQNIFNSNFTINSSGDLTTMVSTWGATGSGERELTNVPNTNTNTFYFPSHNYTTTINGQIITIYVGSPGITINTGNSSVQVGSSYYAADKTFNLGVNQLHMFVLIHSDFWIRIANVSW